MLVPATLFILCFHILAFRGGAQSVPVQGRLLTVLDHRAGPEATWVVQQADSGRIYVLLPGQPTDAVSGRPVAVGSLVALTCRPALRRTGLGDVACARVSGVLVLAAAAPYPSVDISVNWLVMVVNVLPGNCSAEGAPNGVNTTQVAEMVWRPIEGYAAHWDNCSYGNYAMNPHTTRIVSVDIPCTSDTMLSRCEWGPLGRAADVEAAKLFGDDYSRLYNDGVYGRRTYVLPKGMMGPCGFGGLALMPGRQTWLLSEPWNGINDKKATFHEILHTLGLGHASYKGVEYGDFTSPMGSGYGCPSAPELRRLKWASGLGTGLTEADLLSDRWQSYTLASQSVVAFGTYLRITPTWLGSAYSSNLYVSYRVRANGDLGLGPDLDRQVLVHRVGDLRVDNDPYQAAYGDAWPSLMAWAGPGSEVDLPEYRLALRVTGVSASGTLAVLQLCRYAVNASRCSQPDPRVSPPPAPPSYPSPPSPYLSPVSYTFMGCYADNSTRAIPVLLGNGTNMTVAGCAAMAQRAGFLLFGVQAGTQCLGGNSVQDAAVLGQVDTCTTPCAGDATTTCGGELANSVYVLDGVCGGGYYGCFADNWYDFAMTDGLDQGGDFNMTWERCQQAAWTNGWAYFGLAVGKFCWFSADLQNVVKYGVKYDCTQRCSGNPQQVCGGNDDMVFSLYRTDTCQHSSSGGPGNIACRPGACGAYPDYPECVCTPAQRLDTWGTWEGRCVQRLPYWGRSLSDQRWDRVRDGGPDAQQDVRGIPLDGVDGGGGGGGGAGQVTDMEWWPEAGGGSVPRQPRQPPGAA